MEIVVNTANVINLLLINLFLEVNYRLSLFLPISLKLMRPHAPVFVTSLFPIILLKIQNYVKL